jgi:hypothetical protein
MYHYDPTTGGIPPGFPSAINLSVKCVAAAQAQAQVQAQAQMKSGEPTSPGGSVMDLSTSSVTSTSPQVRLPCSALSHLCFRAFISFCTYCLCAMFQLLISYDNFRCMCLTHLFQTYKFLRLKFVLSSKNNLEVVGECVVYMHLMKHRCTPFQFTSF